MFESHRPLQRYVTREYLKIFGLTLSSLILIYEYERVSGIPSCSPVRCCFLSGKATFSSLLANQFFTFSCLLLAGQSGVFFTLPGVPSELVNPS